MSFKSARFSGISRLESVLSNSPAMRYGETGTPVAVIQQALIDAGIPMPDTTKAGPPDGIFLGETKRAVKEFQRRKPQVLTDDGVVGYWTMTKLDELFKGKPKPTKPTSKVPVLPKGSKDRLDAMTEYLVKEAGLTTAQAREVAAVVNAVKVESHAITLLSIAGVISSTGVIAAAGATLGAAGALIGGFIMVCNTWGTGYRIAAHVGYLYGMTAWAYDKPKPPMSEQLKRNILSGFDAKYMHRYREQWDDAVTNAFRDMPKAVDKLRIRGKKIDVGAYKALLQIDSKRKPAKLCMKFAIEMELEIPRGVERDNFVNTVSGKTPCIYNR